MRRPLVVWAILLLAALAPGADACPMCMEAIAGENSSGGNLPLAFYYSILFMLSMPFVIVTGFSVYFYVLHRSARPDGVVEGTVQACPT